MRLLLDANISPRVALGLRTAGYEATHVVDLNLVTATDDEIFSHCSGHGLVLITADTDFGMLLALRRAESPSVVQLRRVAELSPDAHIQLLLAHLPDLTKDLRHGAIVSLGPDRVSIRSLPIG